jgi:uncharacterized delta-60 repeat protein
LCLLLGSASAADAEPTAAPGRVAYSLGGGRAATITAVALADGSAVLAGLAPEEHATYLLKTTPSGAVDPAFGDDGAVRLPALQPLQLLAQADGAVLLVAMRDDEALREFEWGDEHPHLVVVRLTPSGQLDPAYGDDGEVTTTLEAGCECDAVAALQSNGELVLTGQDEAAPRVTGRWRAIRLTTTGSLDASFGAGGEAAVAGVQGTGLSLALTAGDAIVLQGQVEYTNGSGGYGPELMLTRLSANGAPDPSFASGRPTVLPTFHIDDSFGQVPSPVQILVTPGGAVVYENLIAVRERPPKRSKLGLGLFRFTPQGKLDRAYGDGKGFADLHEYVEPTGDALLPGPREGTIAVHRIGEPFVNSNEDGPSAKSGTLQIERVDAAGSVVGQTGGTTAAIPFGGGEGGSLPLVEEPPLTPLQRLRGVTEPPHRLQPSARTNSFLPQYPELPIPLALPDGSFLFAGNVRVNDERPGLHPAQQQTVRFALAKLTPALKLDESFGGPASAMTLSLEVPAQQVHVVRHRLAIRMVADSAAAGLCVVRISAAGHVIAHRVVPLLAAGRAVFGVGLTRFGRRYLAHHRDVAVTATAEGRDLFADAGSASASGTLR